MIHENQNCRDGISLGPFIDKTHLQDVVLVSCKNHADNRGTFMETFNCDDFAGKLALSSPINKEKHFKNIITYFPQDNVSYSHPNVLRGLHIQRKDPQGKLVRCLSGKILDVVVDLRPDSKSFKQWGAFHLCDESKKALWVPPGFAHGFYSYTESIVYYKCSTLYDKESDGGINPFDLELDIKWPSEPHIITNKDRNLPTMSEWLSKE